MKNILYTCLITLSLTACSHLVNGNNTFTNSPSDISAKEPVEKSKPEQKLRMALWGLERRDSLQPCLVDKVSANIFHQIFEGLTRLNNKGEPMRAMAKEIHVSKNLSTYTFSIRDDAKWSNGEQVTAYDFEFAWKWALNPTRNSTQVSQLFYLKNAKKVHRGQLEPVYLGVKALNDKTLEVNLEKPTPFFLQLVALPTYFPINSKLATKHPDWAKDLGPNYTSNGPFKITTWDKEKITLSKNEYYWDTRSVKLDAIEMISMKNENELSMFQEGKLDWMEDPINRNVSSTEPEAMAETREALKKQGLLEVVPAAQASWYAFNTEKKPFNNSKIRKAFAYAINRKQLLRDEDIPAMAVVPPIMFPENAKGYFKDHDVDTAKKLLEEGLREEGYTTLNQLPPVTISFAEHTPGQEFAYIVAEMWERNLGVRVNVELQDRLEYRDNFQKGNFQMAYTDRVADLNDPISFLEIFREEGGNNYTSWRDKKYADLLEQSFKEQDQARRKTFLRNAENLLLEQMPIIPLSFKSGSYAKNQHLKNVVISGLGYVQFKWAHFE